MARACVPSSHYGGMRGCSMQRSKKDFSYDPDLFVGMRFKYFIGRSPSRLPTLDETRLFYTYPDCFFSSAAIPENK